MIATVSELLNPKFLCEYTSFQDINDLLKAGGADLKSVEELLALPKTTIDQLICSASSFSTWEEFLSKATESWIIKNIALNH